MADKKVALVTGGAQGIGEAAVRRLSADGFAVAIADLNLEGAQALADELNANGGTALAIKLDVSDQAAVDAAVDEAADKLGDFNVIVNNAGLAPTTPVGTVTPEQFELVTKVNIAGTMWGVFRLQHVSSVSSVMVERLLTQHLRQVLWVIQTLCSTAPPSSLSAVLLR